MTSIDRFTPLEIFGIFKEQHRLCSPLDLDADPAAILTPEMSIRDWRAANWLVGWKKLGQYLNQEFRIDIPLQDWWAVLEPAHQHRLIEVCQLIADRAIKENPLPKVLFGRPCIKAGLFLNFKKNLRQKGVDVSELRPSSSLATYLDQYFSPIIEEITLTCTRPIEKIEEKRRKKGIWNAINIFDSNRFEILTGEVKTFRDLIEKIAMEKGLL